MALPGCAAHPPASPELTAWVGPLALPAADSLDAAWADSSLSSSGPPNPAPKPRRRRPAPAATVPTGTSEATGQETPAPAAGTEVPPPEPATPQLTVRMAPAEAARLMERWSADVGRAEKALELLKAFTLTGETAEQVTSARKFLADSRTARAASDFYRACELAEKARVLAEAVKTTVGLK